MNHTINILVNNSSSKIVCTPIRNRFLNFKSIFASVFTSMILFTSISLHSTPSMAMTEMSDEELSNTYVSGAVFTSDGIAISLAEAINNAKNQEDLIEAQRLLRLLPKLSDDLSYQKEVFSYFMHAGIPISYTIIFKGQTYDKGVVGYAPDYYEKIYIKDIRIGDGPSYGSVLIRGMDLRGTAVHITVNYDAVQPYNLK